MISRLIELVSFALSQAFDEADTDWPETRRDLADQLEARGFEPEEIEIALDVAGRIKESLDGEPITTDSLRTNQVYSYLEEWRLVPEARGYLVKLQNEGIITHEMREQIVQRCMAIETPEPIGLELMQGLVNWVTFGSDDDLDTFLNPTVH